MMELRKLDAQLRQQQESSLAAPFVECAFCDGKDRTCRACGGTGWMAEDAKAPAAEEGIDAQRERCGKASPGAVRRALGRAADLAPIDVDRDRRSPLGRQQELLRLGLTTFGGGGAPEELSPAWRRYALRRGLWREIREKAEANGKLVVEKREKKALLPLDLFVYEFYQRSAEEFVERMASDLELLEPEDVAKRQGGKCLEGQVGGGLCQRKLHVLPNGKTLGTCERHVERMPPMSEGRKTLDGEWYVRKADAIDTTSEPFARRVGGVVEALDPWPAVERVIESEHGALLRGQAWVMGREGDGWWTAELQAVVEIRTGAATRAGAAAWCEGDVALDLWRDGDVPKIISEEPHRRILGGRKLPDEYPACRWYDDEDLAPLVTVPGYSIVGRMREVQASHRLVAETLFDDLAVNEARALAGLPAMSVPFVWREPDEEDAAGRVEELCDWPCGCFRGERMFPDRWGHPDEDEAWNGPDRRPLVAEARAAIPVLRERDVRAALGRVYDAVRGSHFFRLLACDEEG